MIRRLRWKSRTVFARSTDPVTGISDCVRKKAAKSSLEDGVAAMSEGLHCQTGTRMTAWSRAAQLYIGSLTSLAQLHWLWSHSVSNHILGVCLYGRLRGIGVPAVQLLR